MIVTEVIKVSVSVFDSMVASMIRRVVPSLIANDIVGIQPMDPGILFQIDMNLKKRKKDDDDDN